MKSKSNLCLLKFAKSDVFLVKLFFVLCVFLVKLFFVLCVFPLKLFFALLTTSTCCAHTSFHILRWRPTQHSLGHSAANSASTHFLHGSRRRRGWSILAMARRHEMALLSDGSLADDGSVSRKNPAATAATTSTATADANSVVGDRPSVTVSTFALSVGRGQLRTNEERYALSTSNEKTN